MREHRARLTEAEPEPAGLPPPLRGPGWRPGPGRLGRRGRDPDRDRAAAGVELPHDLVVFPRPVLLLHRRRRTWARSGTATGGRSPTSAACRPRSSMTGPRRWCAATSAAARPPRCIPRRSRSPATTSSRSGWPPRIEPRPRGGWSARSRSSAATCWPVAASPRWASWTPRSPPGCRSAAPQVHRTHGEVIAVRAERDRAALGPLPEQPYVVCDRHTRRVGKDALISL